MIIPSDKISIIGVGSTGFNMAVRFTENGLRVISAVDVKGENVDNLSTVWCHGLDPKHHQQVYIQGLPQLHQQSRRRQGTQAVGPQRSTWWRGRQIFEQSREHLTMGDIILDGANWCEHTERRGKELQPRGVSYISMGVSGYYQSARRGSSISPSGDKGVLDKVMPLLRRIATEGVKTGLSCVANMGPAGCSHYVKMVHNGVEPLKSSRA